MAIEISKGLRRPQGFNPLRDIQMGEHGNMWYVIQTNTGKEREMAELIRRKIPEQYYEACFVIERECMRKQDGTYKSVSTILFNSYVFVITDKPLDLHFELKRIPLLTKMLWDDENYFIPVAPEEQEFLSKLLGWEERDSNDNSGKLPGNKTGQFEVGKSCPNYKSCIVRLSTVELDTEGQIIRAKGPLQQFLDCIVRQRIRRRYVWIRQNFLGTERILLLGIRLETDG